MIEEPARRPGWMKLGLFNEFGMVAADPKPFQDQLRERLKTKLRGVFIHTRGEVLVAVDEAFNELVTEMKSKSLYR